MNTEHSKERIKNIERVEERMAYQMKKLECPRCKKVMEKLKNKKGIVIDRCAKCGGIFLDKGEIQAIKKAGFFHYVANYFRKDPKPQEDQYKSYY